MDVTKTLERQKVVFENTKINDKQKLAIYSENAARLSKINAAIDSAKICDEVAK